MSHGHEEIDEHEEDFGHEGEERSHEGHGGHEDRLFGRSQGHGHGGHDEDNFFEDPVLEPAGTVSDLFFGNEETRTVDLGEFFPVSKVLAVKHNDSRTWNDIRKGKGTVPKLSKPRILRIGKLRSKKTSDLLPRKECAPSLLAYVDHSRVVRPEPLVLIVPPKFPDTAVDVRTLAPHPFGITHPDIFFVRLPVGKRLKRYVRRNRVSLLRSGLIAVSTAAVLLAGTYASVVTVKAGAEDAYNQLFALKSEGLSTDAATAKKQAEAIATKFSHLEWVFLPVETVFDSPVYSHPKVRLAANVLHGGQHLAEAVLDAETLRSDFETAAGSGGLAAFGSGSSFKPTDFAKAELPRLYHIDSELSLALSDYSQVTSLGNPDLDAKFSKAVTDLLTLQTELRLGLSHFNAAMMALGDSEPQRYLILNQNRDELRATGGFPGSAVFVELYKGRLEKYEKKDIYYYDWHLFPFAPKAPAGIDRISEKWGLRDANYYPELEKDFATIDEMYQTAGGSSLNGLIVMNQSLIADLLAKYGPVRLESVGKDLTAENFSTIMSVLVENRVNAKTSAKDVLFEFVEDMEKVLTERKDYAGTFDIVAANAKAGEMLAYSNVPEVNALFSEVLPGEHVKHLEGNFAYPVFTSLSGNKSDRFVHRNFQISARQMDAGSGAVVGSGACQALNHFVLESDHRMTVDDKERIRKLLFDFGIPPEAHEKQIFIQGNGPNKQYVRVLVPKGSKLVGTPPISVTVDDSNTGYTQFAFYTDVDVGQTAGAFFDYASPLAACDADSVRPKFYRQPGLENYNVDIR